MAGRKWSVTVEVDGEFVVAISSDDLCGVPNVDDFREEILDAARNLIAFIGSEKSEFITPEEYSRCDHLRVASHVDLQNHPDYGA